MTPDISLSRAISDSSLLGGPFISTSFWTWKAVAKLIDGLPLNEPREIELFKQCTGRSRLPMNPVKRLIVLVGRRGGKDRFLSAVAVWESSIVHQLAQAHQRR